MRESTIFRWDAGTATLRGRRDTSARRLSCSTRTPTYCRSCRTLTSKRPLIEVHGLTFPTTTPRSISPKSTRAGESGSDRRTSLSSCDLQWQPKSTPGLRPISRAILSTFRLALTPLRETMSPRTYDLAEEITFEIKDTGEVQSVAMKDAPIEIKGQRRQASGDLSQPSRKAASLANGDGKNRATTHRPIRDGAFLLYHRCSKRFRVLGLMSLRLPMILSAPKTAQRDSSAIETPVAIGDLNGLCNVWYRTTPVGLDRRTMQPANATLDDGHENPWLESDEVKESLGEDCRLVDYDGWHLWKADVSTTESTTLEAEELDLASNTVVTGIRIEYGAVAADFTTRSDADSWTRDDLKDEHDDLDDAKAILGTDARGAVVHMQATSAYTPQTALTNSARVDLCRNGGGDKLESHDEDSVIQRCTLPQDLPATGSVPIAACITALLTSGAAALWFARLRSIPKKR